MKVGHILGIETLNTVEIEIRCNDQHLRRKLKNMYKNSSEKVNIFFLFFAFQQLELFSSIKLTHFRGTRYKDRLPHT